MENLELKLKPAEAETETTATKTKRSYAEPRLAVEKLKTSANTNPEKIMRVFKLKLQFINEDYIYSEDRLIEALKMTSETYILCKKGDKNYIVNSMMKTWTDVFTGLLVKSSVLQLVKCILESNVVPKEGRGNRFSSYCWKKKELVIRDYYLSEAMNGSVFRRIGKPLVVNLEALTASANLIKGGASV